MSLEGLLKVLIDGVYVIYGHLCVPICGLFTFDELKLSYYSEYWVCNELAIRANGESDSPDYVWSVVYRHVVCR